MIEPSEPLFRIATQDDAYSVSLPADLIAEFPPYFRARITVGTGEGGRSHTFDATCEAGDTGLLVKADPSAERISFAVGDSTTFDIDAYGIDDPARKSAFWSTPIAEIEANFRFAERRRCRGCSRDATLKIYIDDSICWCYSQVQGEDTGTNP